jgi:penicillin-binding protein 1A
MNKLWKKIFLVAGIAAILPLVIMSIVIIRALNILESREELLNFNNANASVILSHDGQLVGKIFNENRTNVEFEQIPGHLYDALIATEDVRFNRHRGIDTKSLLRVLIKTVLLQKESAGGGSTITQQLAKNMFGRINSRPFPLLVNKAKEFLLARRLEKNFTKEEILTLYLNTVPFGENVFGIEAASLQYFNKKVDELRIEESAVLVGMLKANSLYNPRRNPENSKNRRNVVLSQMSKYSFISEQAKDSLSLLPLKLDYYNLSEGGPADYFVFQVDKEARQILNNINQSTGSEWNIVEDGLVITTTLDLQLQNYASEAFKQHLEPMQKLLNRQYASGAGRRFIGELVNSELIHSGLQERAKEIQQRQVFDWKGVHYDSISVADSIRNNITLLHAGLIALDPQSGAIRAWVGGIDFRSQPFDQVMARRQIGSTLKPLLFAAAIEEGISPCSYLDNDSVVLEGYDEWSPRNFDNTYGGRYSLTGSLVHSMNVPTFNLFMKVGFDGLNSLWKQMGFSFNLDNTPSLPLGTAEANSLEIAAAYSAFANGGYKINPQKIISIKNSEGKIIWENKFNKDFYPVLSERTSNLINAILQKAVREGTGNAVRSVYGISFDVAGKTGTTQEYSDAWFVVYNPGVVIVTRVGASSPQVHFNNISGSGSRLALPIAALTLQKASRNTDAGSNLIKPFPQLSADLLFELECPDYREKNIFEDFTFIFKKEKVEYDTIKSETPRKKRSLFRKIFGGR